MGKAHGNMKCYVKVVVFVDSRYIHGTPALTQISDAIFNVYLPELKIM